MTQLLRKRQIVSILLTLTMLFMLLPGMAWAEGEDTTPPEWYASFPKVSSVSDKEFLLEVRGNEAGKAYFVRLPDGDPAPTSQQVQAGQDASGAALGYPQAGNITIKTTGSSVVRVRGLMPNTPYDVYAVLEDEAGNLQAAPECIEITTTLPSDDNSGITKVEQGEAGSKKITVYVTVKNEQGIGSRGYAAADFSITVDDGAPTTFASAPPFCGFIDTDSDGLYKVTFTGDADNKGYTLTNLTVSGVVIEPGPYAIKTPPPPLAKPTGLEWDSMTPGKAKWAPVDNASSYSVQLYKGGVNQGDPITGVTATEYDFTAAIAAAGNGTYAFTVTAVGDGTNYGNSQMSDISPNYNYSAADAPITIEAIPGVTAPVTGAIPVTEITETAQYSGTVSWSPPDNPFAAATVYTATITLSPKAGYTFTGVSENFFKVAGATSTTNNADSGVVTAVFPATGAGSTGTAVWNYRSPLPSPYLIEDIKYIEGKYMAVGNNSTLLTSVNGISWSKVNLGTDIDRLGGIAYGGGKYVIVGYVDIPSGAARIYTSDDGLSWHQTALVPHHYLYDVAYGNGKFVAVGSAGKIVISTDGENWSTNPVTYPTNKRASLYSITFAAGKFVAVGGRSDTGQAYRGNIMTSEDGVSWDFPYSDEYNTLWDVTYGNNLFVAVGGQNNSGSYFLATSGDGTTWTKHVSSSYAALYSVDFNENIGFIAVGHSHDTRGAFTTTSANGVAWSDKTNSGLPSFRAAASHGTRIVSMGGYGNIYTSDDSGTNWTYRTLGTTKTLKDVAYNGSNLYVAVGEGGTIQTSSDGQSWNLQTSGTTNDLNRVDYLGGQFIAVGRSGTILTSANGTDWTLQTSGTTRELKGLAYGGGKYVVVGGDSSSDPVVLTSDDGASWIGGDTSGLINRSFVAVAYGDGAFLALMNYGQAYRYSVDPDTGEFVHTPAADLPGSNNYPTDMIYAGGKFMAVGGNGEIYLSSDKGENWTLIESQPDSYSRGITYGGGNYVAVGELGKIMGSADGGTTWFVQPSGLKPNHYAGDNYIGLSGITAGDNCFVAVGESGLVLQSEGFTVSADQDAHEVAIARAALDINDILGSGSNANAGLIVADMNLSTTYSTGPIQVNITWTSSKPQYVATDGKVTRPNASEGDQVVFLTATVYKGSASSIKDFGVIVLAQASNDSGDVDSAYTALTFDTIKGSNTAADNIVSNLNLTTSGTNGTTISWVSDKPAYIAADGTVTRPAPGAADEVVTLTATITKGSATKTKTFTLTVKALVDADAQDVADAKAALIFDTIKGSNTAADNIVSNLNLIITGLNGTAINWTSDKPAYIAANGTVTRPAPGAADEVVTLTATITKGAASDTKTFTLTVKALVDTDAQDVADAKAALVFDTIKGSNTAADNIVSNLNLITSGTNGTTISWVSDKPAYIAADGTVTRPAPGAADEVVTLTAVITKGAASDTKTFTLTVTALPSGTSGGGGGGGSYTPSGILVTPTGRDATDTGVSLSFPAGAVESDIRIQIKEASLTAGISLPADSQLLSKIVDIVKDKSGHFSKPVTITMSFDKSKIDPAKYEIGIYYYDEAQGEWVKLDNIEVNLTAGTVSGQVNHFTKFAVIATLKAAADEQPPLPPAPDLPNDIAAHWAEDSIVRLINNGVISGYPDGSFKPDKTVTRAEFVVMLVKAFKMQSQSGATFTDTSNHWARDSIAVALARGIVSGLDKNTFGPDHYITREQAAVMTAQAAKLSASAAELTFIDSRQIAPWAKSSVAAAVNSKVLTGYPNNSFQPKGKLTRAEAAAIIAKLL